MGRQTIVSLVAGHQWRDNSVLLQTKVKAVGRMAIRFRELDFSALNIASDGFLAQCVRDSAAPMHSSDVNAILHTLKSVAQIDSKFRHILSESPDVLTASDITYALTAIDAHYERKNIKSGAALAEKVRNFIQSCQSPLANNILAKQTHFVSLLKVPKRTPRNDIAPLNNSASSAQPIKPSEAIYVETESEFQKIAQKHYEDTLEPIIYKCIEVLDCHLEVRSKLELASKSPLPSNLAKRTVSKFNGEKKFFEKKVANLRSSEERLILALAVVKRNNLHINAPSANTVFTYEIPLLDKLSGGKGSRTRFGVLLSQHYLSRYVVMACYIILLFYTRWNADTLLSVSAGRIKRTAHGYEISGLKSKTNSNQNSEIISDDETTVIEETAAARALELLLWHDANISANAIRHSSSIFSSLRLSYHKVLEFDTFLSNDDFHEFTSVWGLPKFTASDIRPNAERYHYLKTGMHIENSRLVLGHKQESTSLTYVAGDIARNINEAIIIRYQAMLAHAIRFQTHGTTVPTSFGQPQKETIQLLLLPPTRFSSNTDDYLIDKWLESPDDFKFDIGPAEVEQIVRQRNYYLKNMQSLRRTNLERFVRSDVPRILACLALYNITKASPYSRLCQEIEGRLDAQV